MSNSILKISDLNQYYGESHTLWDVSMDINAGTCACLMGRNGMGKTTLLKSIMGLLPIESGKIEFDGQDIAKLPADKRAHIGIGYVPQGREIFGQLTVEENLQIGLQANQRYQYQTIEILQLIHVGYPVIFSNSVR